MFKRVFIPVSERMQPFGKVIVEKPLHPYVPVKMWDNIIKTWEVTNEMEDKTQVVAEDFKHIPSDCCIHCHNKIKPYSTKYFEKGIDEGFEYSFEKSEETGFCETCAKEVTAYATISQLAPSLLFSERTYRDGEELERKVFSDGSVVEDLSQTEIAQKNYS